MMFGGLTHEPAVRLVELSPRTLKTVFFADSGSVSVEAAMKMALEYWIAVGQPSKRRFLSLRNGDHGDTLRLFKIAPGDLVEPLDVIARLAALVPKPRVNLTRLDTRDTWRAPFGRTACVQILSR